MRKILLVSHGKFAEGLLNSVQMLAGEQAPLCAIGMEEPSGAVDFLEKLDNFLRKINPEDSLIVFCDIRFGSPYILTRRSLTETFIKEKPLVFCGMNLPGVLAAVLSEKDSEELVKEILNGSQLELCGEEWEAEEPEDEEI